MDGTSMIVDYVVLLLFRLVYFVALFYAIMSADGRFPLVAGMGYGYSHGKEHITDVVCPVVPGVTCSNSTNNGKRTVSSCKCFTYVSRERSIQELALT